MNQIPQNVAGWLASPKLDGVRSFWTGSAFISRNGRVFTPPASWLAGMPACRLDGELYAGLNSFETLVSIIQKRGSEWEGITFQVFDLAQLRQPIEARLATLAALPLPPHCQLVPHRPLADLDDLDKMESAIVLSGGEGVCLREPGSFYRPGNFWKIKRQHPDLKRNHLD
jgi:DNA ligase-1